jgi:hypothetical protein
MKDSPRAQKGQDERADISALRTSPMGSSGATEMAAEQHLSGAQKSVLDCLQAVDAGLTLKQMQSRLSCSPEVLRSAVDALVERHILCELNTVIPSYTCRYPGINLYGE